jgi:hypothetical protein
MELLELIAMEHVEYAIGFSHAIGFGYKHKEMMNDER